MSRCDARHGLLQQFDGSVDRVDVRRRHICQPAKFGDCSHQGVHFCCSASLDVLQHRGFVRTNPFGASDALVDGHVERNAQALCDCLPFRHHRNDQGARLWMTADVDQRGAGERTDRVECQVAPQFDPDVGADAGAHRRFQPGARQCLGEQMHALAARTVEFAERKPIPLNVADDPRRLQFGRRVNDTANDPFGFDIGCNDPVGIDRFNATFFEGIAVPLEVPLGDAVLRRNDDRRVVKQRAQQWRDGGQLVRLHGNDDDIVRSGF